MPFIDLIVCVTCATSTSGYNLLSFLPSLASLFSWQCAHEILQWKLEMQSHVYYESASYSENRRYSRPRCSKSRRAMGSACKVATLCPPQFEPMMATQADSIAQIAQPAQSRRIAFVPYFLLWRLRFRLKTFSKFNECHDKRFFFSDSESLAILHCLNDFWSTNGGDPRAWPARRVSALLGWLARKGVISDFSEPCFRLYEHRFQGWRSSYSSSLEVHTMKLF